MCWFGILGILGVLIAFNKSTHAAKYSVSGYSAEWLNANCTKAAPILSYKNVFFEVNLTSSELPTSEVWIGYFEAKVPFYFHGCAEVQNEPTYRVTSIGYCKSICVDTELFGIQIGHGQDIFNPTEGMNCRCVDIYIDEIGKCDGDSCYDDCYTIFSQITETGSDRDCLAYYHPGFEWQACRREDSIKPLCSNNIRPDPSVEIPFRTKTWTEGTVLCLNDGRYPATVASIKNTRFETDEQRQYYWTGIARARTVLRVDSTGAQLLKKADLSDVSYGFLDGNTGALHFTSNGTKQALCASDTSSLAMLIEGPKDVTQSTEGRTTIRDVPKPTEGLTTIRDVPKPTEGQTTIKDVTESTAGQTIRNDTNGTPIPSRKSLAVWVGIGVSVAVVVGVVVIIVLRRRKQLKRFTSHKSSASMIDNIDFEAKRQETTEKSVSDHNCPLKGNYSLSENEHLDQSSTANDPDAAIVDAVIYHTINDAVEPHGNLKGDNNDYDYTTTKAVKTERNNDKVYNKLKLENHGDYSHVKGHCQVHDQTTSNHYETASVSFHAHASHQEANDDYDLVEGKVRLHFDGTSNDYDINASVMANRAGSASAKS